MNAEPWVTATEVAQQMDVVKEPVYGGLVPRDVPAHKIGTLRKFQLSAIDEWGCARGANVCADGGSAK